MTDSNMKQVVRDSKLSRKHLIIKFILRKSLFKGNHKHLRIFTSENEEYE